jgi:hypothetical protein
MGFDAHEMGSRDELGLTWQEFEERVRDVLDCAGFLTEFRRVFVLDGRRHEIDVVARRFDVTLLIDAKRYGKARPRRSSLKAQARKHLTRCEEFDRAFSGKSVPVIVSWLDDALLIDGDCFIVPFGKLEDFVVHLEYYVDSIGEMKTRDTVVDDTNENSRL